jgi:hypothetical protein
MTTAQTPPPTLGQTVRDAHLALSALLAQAFARSGSSFEIWAALSQLAIRGPVMARDTLQRALVAGLDLEPEAVDGLLARLQSDGAISVGTDGTVEKTAAGDALYARLRQAGGELSAEVVREIEPVDVETTLAVLRKATARARELLSSS